MTTSDRVNRFVHAVFGMVETDLADNIPERHPTRNSGEALLKRMGTHFKIMKNGDAKEVRRLYSSIRWLLESHEKDEQMLQERREP